MLTTRSILIAALAMAVLWAFGTPACADIVVAHYTFDEGGANLYKDATGANDGQLGGGDPIRNTTTVKAGVGSLDLDGNDWVKINAIADDLAGSTNHSISLWVYSGTSHGQGNLVGANTSGGSNRALLMTRNNLAQFHSTPPGTSGQWVMAGTTQITGETSPTWHHVVYVRYGNSGKIYVDGTPAEGSTASLIQYTAAATDQWSIGQEFDGGSTSDFYTGLIDDVQIYNVSLADWQVDFLKNNPGTEAPVPEPSTLAIWALGLACLGVYGWRKRRSR